MKRSTALLLALAGAAVLGGVAYVYAKKGGMVSAPSAYGTENPYVKSYLQEYTPYEQEHVFAWR